MKAEEHTLKQGDLKIGQELADGSIYIGLSAKNGKPLVTTAEDIGVYTHADAAKAVANLNRHGGGGWRLPSGYLNKEGDELNSNLFENRTKGKLAATFNLTSKVPYWAAEPFNFLYAASQQFSSGVKDYDSRLSRASVRPVREICPRA